MFVAVVTAHLTVRLALKRFRAEKWFERRLDAYTKVIDSLHKMRLHGDQEIKMMRCGRELSDKLDEELRHMYSEGAAELRRLTDHGALVFSSEAVEILESLWSDIEAASREETWTEHIFSVDGAICSALADIRRVAKYDLKEK